MSPYYLAAIDECKLVVVCGLRCSRFVINNTSLCQEDLWVLNALSMVRIVCMSPFDRVQNPVV
jgi:hypothetical protein